MLLLFGTMLPCLPIVLSLAAVWVYGAVFSLVHGIQGTTMGSAYALPTRTSCP